MPDPVVCPVLLAAAGACRGCGPLAANARAVHHQTAQQEERGPDQVQACARVSAELARAHGGEHMCASFMLCAGRGRTDDT